jgi:hypothetical protein
MSLTKVINTGIKNSEITGSKINTASSFSFDVLQANTITVANEFYSNSVNSAYNQANTANVLAQAAYDAANNATDTWVRNAANSASSYANSGFSKANTANTLAQAAYDAANNATDTWVRDASNSASSYANSGYTLANTANTLAQAAYDNSNTKYSLSGGLIDGDVTISGNLTITGNTITHSANDFIINDPIVLLANNNIDNLLDLGFVAHYEDGGANTKHTGLIRDVSTNTWYLFEGYEPHIQDEGNLLDINDSTLIISTLKANLESQSVLIRGQDPLDRINSVNILTQSSFNQANTANIRSQSSYDAANSASSYANGAFASANISDQRAVTSGDYANGAFLQANSASSYANSGYSLANTANTLAQAAYDAANNATDTWVRNAANSASSYANGAYSLANTTNTLAQAAFDAANTSGGGGGESGGSGLFNSAINVAVGYAVTSSLANAVVFSANAIVHSIYLTNISSDSTSNVQVLGDFTPSGTSNVSIFYKIPLPYRSSVEMLKKPQVVKTNDILKLQSFEDDVAASSNAHAIIVYETTTETTYERVGKLVRDTYTNIYTSTSSASVIESIKLVNQDSSYSNHAITVVWTNSSNTLQGYFLKELILPSNSTIEICETPKYMNADDKIDAYSTTTNVISMFVSAKKIT